MAFTHLGNSDATLFSQLLLGLLAGVGVAEVRVEVFVQDLCGLLAEIPPFPSERDMDERKKGSLILRCIRNNEHNMTFQQSSYSSRKGHFQTIQAFRKGVPVKKGH